jgi:hypothetical protein
VLPKEVRILTQKIHNVAMTKLLAIPKDHGGFVFTMSDSPNVGGEEPVRSSKGVEGRFQKVSLRPRVPARLLVPILKTRKLQQLLGAIAATIPVPRGAGMKRIRTLPHFPVSSQANNK